MFQLAGALLCLLLPAITVGAFTHVLGLAPVWSLTLTCTAILIPAITLLFFERRKSLQMTLRARDFTQRLLNVIPQPFYVKDASGRYQIVNQAFAKDRGRTIEQLIGASSYDFKNSPIASEERALEDAAALRGEAISLEKHTHINGCDHYQHIMKGSCLDINGEQVVVVASFDISPWRTAERQLTEALQQKKNQYQHTLDYIQRVMDVIPYPVYVKDAQSRYLLVNQAMALSKGVSAESLLGNMGLNENDSIDTLTRHFVEDGEVLAGHVLFKEEQGITPHNNQEFHHIVTKGTSFDSEGKRIIVGAHFDLTDLRMAENNLNASLEREVALRISTQNFVRQVIDLIPDPVFIKNADGRYLMVNSAFANERGRSKEAMIGLSLSDLTSDSAEAELSIIEDRAVVEGGEITKEQHTTLPLTGEECYRIIIKRRCVYLDGSPVVFGMQHYITRWKIAALEFQHLSWKDPLTGIANRRHFMDEAEKAIALAHRSGSPLVMAMLDLDHFKNVNDEYGHPVGDEVLIEMVRRCQSCLRSSDLIARWGGEEFIVIFPFTAPDAGVLAAERLRASIADSPFQTSSGQLPITASIGLASLQAREKLDQLTGRADAALYQAKGNGRNQVCSS